MPSKLVGQTRVDAVPTFVSSAMTGSSSMGSVVAQIIPSGSHVRASGINNSGMAGTPEIGRSATISFTEHGVIMASVVLNSPHAVEMSVYVVRAFVHLRELLSSNRELARRFAQLETRLDRKFTEHDRAIGALLSTIRM